MSKLGIKIGVTHAPRRLGAYDTPASALPALLACQPPCAFIEPCAGGYVLAGHLEAVGFRCALAIDLEPRDPRVLERDGTTITPGPEVIITNPPFGEAMLMPLLRAWVASRRVVWTLLPSDTLMNAYFGPVAWAVTSIAPIGRVRWIPGSKGTSTDNFAWVQFNGGGVVRGLLRGRV